MFNTKWPTELSRKCWSWLTEDIQPLVFNLLASEEFTPTKSRRICGFELSNRMSWRNRSSKKTLRERYPASRHLYHLCLFFSNLLLKKRVGKSN
jgi:hypothetical protein